MGGCEAGNATDDDVDGFSRGGLSRRREQRQDAHEDAEEQSSATLALALAAPSLDHPSLVVGWRGSLLTELDASRNPKARI